MKAFDQTTDANVQVYNIKPLLSDTEKLRMECLQEYNVLDTPPEEKYDAIVRLAAHICVTPMAGMSLIDSDRQWFKSTLGLNVTETPRNISFCAHAILQPDLLIVPDALDDDRFKYNPLTMGEPHVRFYAAVPLVTEEGHALGSLCVVDVRPRTLSQEQQDGLRTLAHQVVAQLELARSETRRDQLVAKQENLAARLRQSEEYRRTFLRDVLAGATDGRLLLCESPNDFPQPMTPFCPPIALSRSDGIRQLRKRTQDAAMGLGMSKQKMLDLITAASETAMNAVVHAVAGVAQVFVGEHSGTIQVAISDEGPGIPLESIPYAALKKGYTTKGTLGHGMKITLKTADRVFLLTQNTGTSVVLEQDCVGAAEHPFWG